MNKYMKNHITQMLDKGVRLDGRKPLEFRQPIKVEYGVSINAEGSAQVTIGNTVVLAGIKMEVSKPYPDSADRGSLMVGAELLPMSSPDFEPGPPGIEAIEIGRVVDRGIREGHALDLHQLCITEGEQAWTAVIDICSINHDGNLFDAGAVAAIAALKDAQFPELDGSRVIPKTKTGQKLPIQDLVISCTVLKIGNHFIVDPTIDEEKAADARITVGIKSDGTVCSMQKGGDLGLSAADIDQMVSIAADQITMLRKLL